MSVATQSAPEMLREEILAEARRQSDQILDQARKTAKSLLAQAAADTEVWRRQQLAQAHAEAERRAQLVLATVPLEAERLRAARLETSLQSLCDEARRRLATGEGYDLTQALIALAVKALSHMAGKEFTITISSADGKGQTEIIAEQIAQRLGSRPLKLTVTEQASATRGHLLVQDAEGRQAWDNSLLSRVERLWPELRRQIAVQAGLLQTELSAGGRP